MDILQIVKKPDELWTSYLARRLKDIGVEFTDFMVICVDDISQYPDFIFSTLSMAGLSGLSNEISIRKDLCYSSPLSIESTLDEGRDILTTRNEMVDIYWLRNYLPRNVVSLNRTIFSIDTIRATDFCVIKKEIEGYNAHYPEIYNPAIVNETHLGFFNKYEENKRYPAEEVIDDIVRYAAEIKPASGFPSEIIGYGYLPETNLECLYFRAINNNPNNFQFFEYQGFRIPYVLVDSSDIGGHVGRRLWGHLYFVARDIATEPWQQQIEAYNQLLNLFSNDEGKKRHKLLSLASLLGKEKEYLEWRKK